MGAQGHLKKTVVPIRHDAKAKLDELLGRSSWGATQVEVVSNLVLWFVSQHKDTQAATLDFGAGRPVENAANAKALARFGDRAEEQQARESSADPPQLGIIARPAESRPAPRRAMG